MDQLNISFNAIMLMVVSIGIIVFGAYFLITCGKEERQQISEPDEEQRKDRHTGRLLCVVVIVFGIALFATSFCAMHPVEIRKESYQLATNTKVRMTNDRISFVANKYGVNEKKRFPINGSTDMSREDSVDGNSHIELTIEANLWTDKESVIELIILDGIKPETEANE